nr:gtpase der [Quercus suber]
MVMECLGLENCDEEEEDYVPAIAIVGRPNIGKSSILNALVGEDRTIVSPISGTTHDAIDTEFSGSDGQMSCLMLMKYFVWNSCGCVTCGQHYAYELKCVI